MSEEDQKAFEEWISRANSGAVSPFTYEVCWEYALAHARKPAVLKRMDPPDEPGVYAWILRSRVRDGGPWCYGEFPKGPAEHFRDDVERLFAYLGPIPEVEEEEKPLPKCDKGHEAHEVGDKVACCDDPRIDRCHYRMKREHWIRLFGEGE